MGKRNVMSCVWGLERGRRVMEGQDMVTDCAAASVHSQHRNQGTLHCPSVEGSERVVHCTVRGREKIKEDRLV